MSTYVPDCWVLVKIYSPEYPDGVAKVLAGWYGGYCGSASWKLSSGAESVTDNGDHYEFLNSSGSVYVCHKELQRMSGYMSQIYNGWKNESLKDEGKFRIEIEEKIV